MAKKGGRDVVPHQGGKDSGSKRAPDLSEFKGSKGYGDNNDELGGDNAACLPQEHELPELHQNYHMGHHIDGHHGGSAFPGHFSSGEED